MNEKEYLRDLAKHQLELAFSARNEELKKEWYDHNSLKGKRPMVVFEEETCKDEFLQLQCEDRDARFLEAQMQQNIKAFEFIADDKVIPEYLKIPVQIQSDFFGVKQKRTVATEKLGYHIEPVLQDLSEDLVKLKPSEFHFDREATEHLENLAADWLGDLLPARRVNTLNYWHFTPTQHVGNLMGMENMFLAMYEHRMNFINSCSLSSTIWFGFFAGKKKKDCCMPMQATIIWAAEATALTMSCLRPVLFALQIHGDI